MTIDAFDLLAGPARNTLPTEAAPTDATTSVLPTAVPEGVTTQSAEGIAPRHREDGLERRWLQCRRLFEAQVTSRGDPPSEATQRKYLQVHARMRLKGTNPTQHIRSQNTYYYMRAAWSWGVLCEVQEVLAKTAYAIATDDWQRAAQLLDQCDLLADDFRRFVPDPQRNNRNDPSLVGEFRQLRDDRPRPRSTSKRIGLDALPAGWRDLLVAEAEKSRSCYLLAIAVLSATGCRPAEVAKGIRVVLTAEGQLQFLIQGAKVVAGRQGQPWRRIQVPIAGYDTRVLATAVQAAGGKLLVGTASAKGLGWAVGYFGKRVYPGPGHRICCYSLRHELGADLKGDGTPPATIAAVLGHLVDGTSGTYGRPGTARGKRQLKVTAALPVKPTSWTSTVATKAPKHSGNKSKKK
jgi:integrase